MARQAKKQRRAQEIASRNPGVNYAKLKQRLKALRDAGVMPPGYNLLPPFSRASGATGTNAAQTASEHCPVARR